MTLFDEFWLINVPVAAAGNPVIGQVAAAGQLPVCKVQCQHCSIALRLLVATVSFLDMKSLVFELSRLLPMTNLLDAFKCAAPMCDSCHQSHRNNLVSDLH
jgi:hypothetical protein